MSTYYALKVKGQIITGPVVNTTLLEQKLATLPEDERAMAQIVPVTADGKELLFG